MRKLLNTLYIMSKNAYLHRDGENVVVSIDGKETARRPVHILEGVVCMNYTGMSPMLMRLLADNNISVAFIDQYGKFAARLVGRASGNVLLRRAQYRLADDERACMPIITNMIRAKLNNSRKVLLRAARDHKDSDETYIIAAAAKKLKDMLAFDADTRELLRGIEGDAARAYFSVFDGLILHNRDDFHFNGRSRRPPMDNVNAMLSFAYTLLTHETVSALETVGLDPYVGLFHADRPGRTGLALDIIEELRAYAADRFVLTLINRQQMTGTDFLAKEGGGVLMSEDGRKKFISAWQSRKNDIITHPFLNEKIEFGLLPYVQSMLLARHLRGDIEGYPPFLME